ncbi:MAG: hypothetical protein WCL02_03070 [bacterium]
MSRLLSFSLPPRISFFIAATCCPSTANAGVTHLTSDILTKSKSIF